MIGLGYSLVKSFNPLDDEDEIVVPGRVSLLSLAIHTRSFTAPLGYSTIQSLWFTNGESEADGGDVRYKFRPFGIPGASVGPVANHTTYQVNMGSAGILFEDGIYFEWESATTNTRAVDNIVLFYM
ncbi:MAG: hypothetical protein CL489_16720 [Acidobacteria bacterium]|nr:hypothetical protein [Acidobacteriota bacterium]